MPENGTLANIGEKKVFGANSMVFMQNDSGQSMYVVLTGSFGVYVNTFNDNILKIAKISPGGFFGEMSILDGSTRSATIMAEEKSIALEIKRHEFTKFMIQNPKTIPAIMTTITQRINSASEELEKMGQQITPSASVKNTLANGNRMALMLLKKEPKKIMEMLEELSKHLRELNELLGNKMIINSIPAWTDANDEEHSRLFPTGHKTYGVTERSSNANYVSMKNVICPVCEHAFIKAVPVVSKLIDDKVTRDLRPAYKDFDFLWYGVWVCPKCNYADYYNTFASLHRDRVNALKERGFADRYPLFNGFSNPRTVDEVIESYYLLIKCQAMVSNDPFPTAKAYIRLYWLYSDLNDSESAENAASEALSYYDKTLAHDSRSYNAIDLLQLRTTAAELALYLGEKEKAVHYYLENLDIDHRLRPALTKQAQDTLTELKVKYT